MKLLNHLINHIW